MIHMKDGLHSKAQLSDFSVVVLHHAVVLLLLTHSCAGQSQAVGPPQPVVAMVDDDIILPCHLEPSQDAVAMTVEWARPELEPRFAHLRRDGMETLTEQNSLYVGRTSLSTKALKCGDLSLKLSKVKLSDAGTYKCIVPQLGTVSAVELAVGSGSLPGIEISAASRGVVLDCGSKGWYPEPEVLWLDAEGNLLSAGPTETVRGPDDLYTVSSRVTVEKRHSNSFTCRVQQKDINQTREALIRVSDDFFVDPSSPAVRISISLVSCFMCLLIIGLVVWKINKTKMRQDETERGERKIMTPGFGSNLELQLLMEEHKSREQLMTQSEKIKYLDTTKAKLDEQLQKNEGDLQHVTQVITTLTEQKDDLQNQTEKLNSLLQEVKTRTVQNEKKLKEKAKLDKDKKMKKRENTKEVLEREQTECVDLLENTKKLLKRTEQMIIEMTERKGKLENYKEQINKNLKEIKKQKDEAQKKLESEREEGRHDACSDDAQEKSDSQVNSV